MIGTKKTCSFSEQKRQLVLGFCAISLIRKQRQRRSITFNNFNTSLVGIKMFKVNNKNTGTRWKTCSKLTIKIPGRRYFALSVFNS